MKYRPVLADVIGGIIREWMPPTREEIGARARPRVEEGDLPKFVQLAEQELAWLYEGNVARYRIRPSEFRAWLDITRPDKSD